MDTSISSSYQRFIDAVCEQLQYVRIVADNSGGMVFSKTGPLPVYQEYEGDGESGQPPTDCGAAHVSCIDGKVADPKKLQQTSLRMCVINAIVMWESFIRDIADEAFTLAYKEEKFDATKCETILTQAIVKYFDFSETPKMQPPECTDKKKEKKKTVTTKIDLAKKVYDKLESLDKGKFSHTLYKAHLNNKMQRRYSPVLSQIQDLIKETFADKNECKLFQSNSPLYFYYKRPDTATDLMSIGFKAANDIIMLFYALYCRISQERFDIKTLEDFPKYVDSATREWEIEDGEFVIDFLKLYERIKKLEMDKSTDLCIDYRTVCNILYFVEALAFKVMEYLRRYLQLNYHLFVWGTSASRRQSLKKLAPI